MKQSKKAISNNVSDTSLKLSLGMFFLFLTIATPILLSKGNSISPALLKTEMGVIGSFFYKILKITFGMGSNLLFLLTFIFALFCLFPKFQVKKINIYGILSLYLLYLTYLHLAIPLGESFSKAYLGNGGGVLGALLSYLLLKSLGITLTKLILLTLIFISLILGSEGKLFKWLSQMNKKVLFTINNTKSDLESFIYEEKDEKIQVASASKTLPNKKPFSSIKAINETITEVEHLSDSNNIENPNKTFCDNLKSINQNLKENEKVTRIENFIDNTPYPNTSFQSKKHTLYKYPPFDLLVEGTNSSYVSDEEIERNADILIQTLNNFGVKGNITGISVGPSITEYEFQPAPGIKISKIVNLSDDIALNLATSDIRIQAPIPGKAAVGIEVPNKRKASVNIRGILESGEFINHPSKIITALGKDISGNNVFADLGNMPHLLIAGSTGSGKSVCLNALIISILYKAHPDEVKFLMVDPKMVELASYNNIPHLITPVVTDAKKAASALRWAVQEMENRYTLFAEAGVKDLERYNKKVLERIALNNNEEDRILPKILIIIDELADLMMVAPNDVEDAICRLAQMARAAGMHLIIATQRPSVDVITGIIKANIPSRIAFAVSSQIDSRTILDMSGAEKLLGQGDMLYYPRGIAKPIRVQGCYVSDKEIDTVVNSIKVQGSPIYDDNIKIFSEKIDEENESKDSKTILEDDLLAEATLLFIENGQASISMLQRNFRIGYTRAARIIDTLADLGYIGPYEGSKPRKTVITLDEYNRIFNKKED